MNTSITFISDHFRKSLSLKRDQQYNTIGRDRRIWFAEQKTKSHVKEKVRAPFAWVNDSYPEILMFILIWNSFSLKLTFLWHLLKFQYSQENKLKPFLVWKMLPLLLLDEKISHLCIKWFLPKHKHAKDLFNLWNQKSDNVIHTIFYNFNENY